MISTFIRLLGVTAENQDPKQYEPVFGLPKQSLDEWCVPPEISLT